MSYKLQLLFCKVGHMELKGCISKLKMLRWCSSPKRSGLRKEERQENDRQKIQKNKNSDYVHHCLWFQKCGITSYIVFSRSHESLCIEMSEAHSCCLEQVKGVHLTYLQMNKQTEQML